MTEGEKERVHGEVMVGVGKTEVKLNVPKQCIVVYPYITVNGCTYAHEDFAMLQTNVVKGPPAPRIRMCMYVHRLIGHQLDMRIQ